MAQANQASERFAPTFPFDLCQYRRNLGYFYVYFCIRCLMRLQILKLASSPNWLLLPYCTRNEKRVKMNQRCFICSVCIWSRFKQVQGRLLHLADTASIHKSHCLTTNIDCKIGCHKSEVFISGSQIVKTVITHHFGDRP